MNQNQIVPMEPATSGDIEQQAVQKAREKLDKMRSVKLPFCTRYLVMRRVNNFTKIAVMAAICTLILAVVKFELSLQAEKNQALVSLQNTGKTVAKSLKLQMEADFATLDGVANLWHLDSRLGRQQFRKFVMSRYFEDSLIAMQTIILIHRIQDQHRNAYETDPASIQVRTDCCNLTKYDIPSQDLYCRVKAKNQCNIPGENKFYITAAFPQEDGSRKILPAASDDKEHLVVFYQEPLERNPGPTGFDIGSLPSRQAAFDEASTTGEKAVTRRMLRVFATNPEFGMLVWNNIFTDKNTLGNKTLLTDQVEVYSKQEIEDKGGDPYAIGSVVAVYQLQNMFVNIIKKVFGREIQDTRLFLFDDRASTPEEERLLGLYDPLMTEEEMAAEMVRLSDNTKAQLTAGKDSQVNSFSLDGATTAFTVGLIPTESYFQERVSRTPYYILAISIGMIIVAQIERWLGHPWIVSQHQLIKAAMESEIKDRIKQQMVYGANGANGANNKLDVGSTEATKPPTVTSAF